MRRRRVQKTCDAQHRKTAAIQHSPEEKEYSAGKKSDQRTDFDAGLHGSPDGSQGACGNQRHAGNLEQKGARQEDMDQIRPRPGRQQNHRERGKRGYADCDRKGDTEAGPAGLALASLSCKTRDQGISGVAARIVALDHL